MSRKSLSASGARIRGDDYQHLVAWYQVLRALLQGSDITAIGIEDPDPFLGNADDVTVYRRVGRNEFYQVKSSVDARAPLNCAWLTSPSRSGGPSVLQRLYEAWRKLTQNGQFSDLFLVTNKLIDPTDPVMALLDGRDGTVARQLQEADCTTVVGKMRRQLGNHVGIEEAKLIEFLRDLHFRVGKLHEEWEDHASMLMYALGLRHDSIAVQQGISTVRRWVTDARRILTADEIRHQVKSLHLEAAEPAAILLVQAIDHDPMPESVTIALDWVGLYQGNEPKTRRRLRDNRLWNKRLRPEVQEAKHLLRSKGFRRILVRGYMRLPSWFTIGAEMGETAGFDVITFQGGQEWSSNGVVYDFPVSNTREVVIGPGEDLAIGVSLSVDLSDEVLTYVTSNVPDVGRYICFAPTSGPNNRAIRDSSDARGWALNLRNQVRDVVRRYRPKRLHLFLATPGGAALLLGHLWDRMPDTQLYEDQGVCGGYLPSFFIPN